MTKTIKAPDLLENKSSRLKWIVLLFGFLIYANTLDHEFALDDYSVILEHSHVQAGIDGIPEILSTNYRHGQQGFNDGLYRPLSLVTFAVEKSWFNSNTTISHFINVLLYAFGGFLLFLSLQKIFEKEVHFVPFAICMLFLAHPLHTEIVANIKGRDELLAFFGFALTLFSFLNLKKHKGYLLLGILSFIIALLSKENAVIFAFFIPALILLNRENSLKDIQTHLLVLLPLVIFFVLWRNHIIGSMENAVDPGNFGILNNPIAATEDASLRWGSTFALQWTFLSKLLYPVHLIHDYSYNQIPLVGLFSPASLFGILAYLALIGASLLGVLKKNRWGYISILYLLSIGVASQILLPIGIQFAERMLFMAVLPFSIALVFILKKTLQGKNDYLKLSKQKTLYAIFFGFLVIYAAKTFNRNADWKNNFSLYSADIDHSSNSARANYNYGSTLTDRADQINNANEKSLLLRNSINYLSKAVTIYPDYLDAWNNLGITYKKQGNYAAAIDVYKQNIQRDPSYTKNYYNLSTAYFQMKDYRNSIESMTEYTSRVPNSPDAYMLMAQAAGNLQSFGEAISFLNAYLQYRPNDPNGFNMLGMAYGSIDQFAKANASFEKALKIEPGRADILFNMAINFNRQGNVSREEKTLRRLLEIQPNHQNALRQMAVILEAQGRMAEAMNYKSRLQ